jgi:hypothetical protein
MAATSKEKCPVGSLNEDGWWSVFQFLTGNDIATVLGVSRLFSAMSAAAGIWTNAVSTITIPTTPPPDGEIGKWRLRGEQIAINSYKLSANAILRSAIEDIAFNTTICPNMQSLSMLHLPSTVPAIEALTSSLKKRAQSGQQLKKLVLELRWFDNANHWDRRNALLQGLMTFPEEVEFGWIQGEAYEKRIHHHYRAAILDLFSYNTNTLKFTLPGCIWADCGNDLEMSEALEVNSTVQSLTFRAPFMVSVSHFIDHPDGRINNLAKMLVHPSLRHLSISDQVVSGDFLNHDADCNFTALYFAASRCFSESTLETLHIELGRETPRGLLAVLHGVADMPQLKRFSLSWPNGGHPVPQQVSMERLREYLKTSALLETYNERPKSTFLGREKPADIVNWSTLSTIFI